MPDDKPVIADATRQVLIVIAAGVVAFVVLGIAGLYAVAVWTGRASIPEDVQSKVWAFVTGLLVVGSTAVMTYVSSKNAERSRQNANANAIQTQAALGVKVEAVGAALHDGIKNDFAAAAADLVAVNADKTAAALVDTNVAAATKQAIDDAAQKTRDDLASMREMIAQLMAQRAAVPVEPQPALVAPNGDAIHTTELAANTAAQVQNTIATDSNTEGRLTVPEEAAQPDAPPPGGGT